MVHQDVEDKVEGPVEDEEKSPEKEGPSKASGQEPALDHPLHIDKLTFQQLPPPASVAGDHVRAPSPLSHSRRDGHPRSKSPSNRSSASYRPHEHEYRLNLKSRQIRNRRMSKYHRQDLSRKDGKSEPQDASDDNE